MHRHAHTRAHTNLEAAHKLYNLWKRASIANTSPMIYGHWSAPWAVAARRFPIDKQLGNAMQTQSEPTAKSIGKRKLAQWQPEGERAVPSYLTDIYPTAQQRQVSLRSAARAALHGYLFVDFEIWFYGFSFRLTLRWFSIGCPFNFPAIFSSSVF